jgi:hypothetical protein
VNKSQAAHPVHVRRSRSCVPSKISLLYVHTCDPSKQMFTNPKHYLTRSFTGLKTTGCQPSAWTSARGDEGKKVAEDGNFDAANAVDSTNRALLTGCTRGGYGQSKDPQASAGGLHRVACAAPVLMPVAPGLSTC